MDLVIALDAGTTSIRAIAWSAELEVLTVSTRGVTNHFPQPGHVEQDLNDIARLVLEVLAEVSNWIDDHGHRCVALGITNQRETTVAIDRASSHHHARAIVWQDRRTDEACAELERRGVGAVLRERTGLVADAYFSATKMAWLLESGALREAEQPALGTIDSFILWLLTGEAHGGVWLTEPSNASRTLLLDLATASWSEELLELFSIPRDHLADIQPSVSDFGTVGHPQLGSLAGVPIRCVLGDQQAALFGHGALDRGQVKVTYGTGSFLLATAGPELPEVRDGLISTIAWDLGDFGPRTYAYEGAAFVAGAAIQWWRDEIGLIERAEDITTLAERVTDSAGVSFVPAFSGLGSPQWRSEARGTITGLSRGVTREHLARATLEALAFQVRAMTDAFRAAGLQIDELRVDGGAAASSLLLEMQATSSRATVHRSDSLEITARGVAAGAALSVGLIESLDVYRGLWRSAHKVEPGEALFLDMAYEAWCRAAERA